VSTARSSRPPRVTLADTLAVPHVPSDQARIVVCYAQREQHRQERQMTTIPREAGDALGEPTNVRVLLTGLQTSDRFTLVEHHLPPYDSGVPHHVHPGHSEGCYVLEGTLAVTQADCTITLAAGKATHIPASVPHTYWNPTGAPTVVLLIYMPGVAAEAVPTRATGPPVAP